MVWILDGKKNVNKIYFSRVSIEYIYKYVCCLE